ncbi:hypothetical protein J1N35_034362 [Gossypium stocksii]|uniref:Uncharacterized protein n=1 Tax=Gossypium stocksii TaxID=47602 RepID=A0A9D3URX3_9ROSI|nr:hypothetical protein J1N35_034362 [Gossypium stocksii]
MDVVMKMEKVGQDLGHWQVNCNKRVRIQIEKLKAKVNNIVDGPYKDNNISELKETSMSRKKKNHIEKLMDANGCWKYMTTDICNVAREYFQNLFTTSNPLYEENPFNLIKDCITDEMNYRLTKDFTENEITKAFHQMDLHKAP